MTRPLVQGFAYAATFTHAAEGMRAFFAALGVGPSSVPGASAAMYRFADGSFFGVATPDDDAEAELPADTGDAVPEDRRIVGFRVSDLREACAALEAAGFPILDEHENALSRYSHVTGPDGRLYELVELLGS